MRFDFVGRAVHDVDPATVGFPTRNSRREMLVGISDAPVVLFLVLVLFGIRRGIAALPESLNKIVAFFVVRQLLEGGPFLVGDDPDYVLIQPLLVDLGEFDFERSFLLLLLLFIGLALQGIDLIGGLSGRAGNGCAGLGITPSSGFVALGARR